MSVKRVLGIDPGYGIIGYGLVVYDEKTRIKKLESAGVIKTPKEQEFYRRLYAIQVDLNEIVAECKPDIAVIERLFFSQNTTTALNVAHARGVILATLAAFDIPIIEYTPLQIKQTVVGYGWADKNQVQQMVKLQLDLKDTLKPDDCADAVAAALAYILNY